MASVWPADLAILGFPLGLGRPAAIGAGQGPHPEDLCKKTVPPRSSSSKEHVELGEGGMAHLVFVSQRGPEWFEGETEKAHPRSLRAPTQRALGPVSECALLLLTWSQPRSCSRRLEEVPRVLANCPRAPGSVGKAMARLRAERLPKSSSNRPPNEPQPAGMDLQSGSWGAIVSGPHTPTCSESETVRRQTICGKRGNGGWAAMGGKPAQGQYCPLRGDSSLRGGGRFVQCISPLGAKALDRGPFPTALGLTVTERETPSRPAPFFQGHEHHGRPYER